MSNGARFQTRVATGVIVSTIVDPEQAQTVVFTRAPHTALGFETRVSYHDKDPELEHFVVVMAETLRRGGPRPIARPRRTAVAR